MGLTSVTSFHLAPGYTNLLFRPSRVFETQKEAIARGREIAINQQSELYIHNQKGQIRERNSYGNDPHPPKG